LAEGVEPRLEAVVFVTAVLFVESLGLCVVVLVDTFLAGVDRCVGFTGLVVGVRIAWRKGLDVYEGDLAGEWALV